MKYPCGLIQDLLPLYVEDMASGESKAAVEEHLQECTSCQKVLESLRKPEKVPQPEIVPLRKVKRSISARKWKTVAAAVCIVLAVSLSVISYLTTAHYIPYTEDLFTITTMEDGGLRIQVRKPVSGYMINGGGNTNVYELEIWREPLYAWSDEMIELSAEEAENARIYYLDYQHEDVLIYGEPVSGGRMTLPRLVLNYYLLIAGGLAVVLGIFYLCFRKKKAGKALFSLWMVPVCYLAGHLCVKGVSGLSVNSMRDLCFILVTGACWYGAMMLFRSLRREKNIGAG